MTSRRSGLLALVSLFLLPSLAIAQNTEAPRNGRIIGRVLDESGSPVPGAQVGIAAGGPSVTAGVDGRYTIMPAPSGVVALSVRAIGFSPKTVSGVIVPVGGVVSQDIVLTTQTVQVGEITVSTAMERGSVAAALEEQRNSNNVINSVTAEQIARTPDSDAAQAVQRVSGVTVQDGRYVFVRGLGERYTTTSLNNVRMPSPEPERRLVPLDLFPANLLDGITTTKTFSVDQPGDFSGGQVNLRTREFPLRRTLTFSTSAGLNTGITGRSSVHAPGLGGEWRVSAGSERQLPAAVGAAGNFTGLTEPQVQSLIGQFRNSWSGQAGEGSPNGSFSASLGGEDPVLGLPLGYLFSFGYSGGQDVRLDERRSGIAGDSVTQNPINTFSGRTVTSSVLLGGLANITLRAGGHKLSFNNTLTRSGDNVATRLAGPSEEWQPVIFDITRLSYVERSVLSSQLQGQHLLGFRNQVEWSATRSSVARNEPDRSDLIYEATIDSTTSAVTPLAWFERGGRSAVRTFSALDETSLDLSLSWRLELGESRRSAVKVGLARRSVERDADSRAYLIRNSTTNGLSDTERQAAPEQIFADPSRLTMIADAAVGRYTAQDEVLAGFAQAEIALGARVRLIGGLRVERWNLDLSTQTIGGPPLNVARRNTDPLPSLSLTYSVNATQNLRVSASQTLSRPEYREIADIASRDIVGGYDFYGNPSLVRALIQNFDVRWEWYPGSGEVISIGVFAKRFDHPIERTLRAQVGLTAIRPENSRSARNLGLEFEFRRSLAVLSGALLPFSVFTNVTLMHSQIQLEDTSTSAEGNERRPLTGQAPFVVNAGLGYQHPRSEFNATLLYNVVGRRISELGTQGFPDVYEEPRHVVDLAVRFPILRSLSGKVDARNLLDADYHNKQGSLTRLRYRSARAFAVGLSWNP